MILIENNKRTFDHEKLLTIHNLYLIITIFLLFYTSDIFHKTYIKNLYGDLLIVFRSI